jgi:hypothetical protein
MRNQTVDETLNHHILSLLERGHSRGEIESSLRSEGHDAGAIRPRLFKLNRAQTSRRQVQATSLIIAGAVLCLLGLLMTLLSPHPHYSIYMTMYGLASIGALLALAGVLMILIL